MLQALELHPPCILYLYCSIFFFFIAPYPLYVSSQDSFLTNYSCSQADVGKMLGALSASVEAGSIFRVVSVCLQSLCPLFDKFQVQCQSSWTDEVVCAQKLSSAIATVR